MNDYFHVLPSEFPLEKNLNIPQDAIELIPLLESHFKAEFVQFVFAFPGAPYAIMRIRNAHFRKILGKAVSDIEDMGL